MEVENEVIQEQVVQEQDPSTDIVEQPKAIEVDSWSTNPKYASYAKDPTVVADRLYKDYQSLNKVYTPTQQVLSKYGYKDHKALEAAITEYQGLKDPNNEVNRLINRLNSAIPNEEYAEAFKNFITQLEEKQQAEKWGKNLPPEIRQQLEEASQLKQQFAKLEEDKQIDTITNEITSKVTDIEGFAEANGLEFDKPAFISYCRERNVPPEFMMDVFKAAANETIQKINVRKAEDGVMKNLEKNRKGALPSGKTFGAAPSGAATTKDKLNEFLGIDDE